MKGLFELPKHKVFEYKPLYYDPDKERLKARKRELGLTNDSDVKAGTGDLLRSGALRTRHAGFMQEMEDNNRRMRVRRLTLIVIFGLVVYLVYSGKLDSLLELFARA